MVDMNPDLVLEVPDTPDRIGRSIEVSSGRDIVEVQLDPQSSHRKINLSKRNSAHLHGEAGRGNVASSSATPPDTELLFQQAGLARLLSETLEVKSSLQNHGKPVDVRGEGFSNDNGKKAATGNLRQKRQLSSSSSIRHKDASGKTHKYSSTESDGSQDERSCGNAVFLGADSVGSTGSQSRINISTETNTELHNKAQAGLDFVDNKEKGIVHGNDSNFASKQALSSPVQSFSPQRHVGQRRLVRNGCISPCNIAKGTTKSHKDGEQEFCSAYGRVKSSFPRVTDQDKRNELYLSKNPQLRTEQTRPMNNRLIISDSIAEIRTARKNEGEVGKRNIEVSPSGESHEMHSGNPHSEGRHGDNKKGKEILDDLASSSMPDDKAKFLSNRSNPITKQPLSKSSSEKRSQRPTRGKRKNSNCGPGESSTSFDDPEISYLGSWQPTNPRAARTRNARHQKIVLGPVIEVDEMDYPGDRSFVPQDRSGRISDDSRIRARQVESDEVLARQLQEQFYNESSGVPSTEEIDASVALSLQQEEVARRTSAARRDQNNIRGASNARPRARTSSSSNFTSGAQHPTAARMAQVMRGSNWSRMDVLMRLNWFEEMEAAYDSINSMDVPDFLRVQRDFNENDYEMLLALDENNHNHAGASRGQINNLPQSVVQSDNVEECAVCLEKPSIGDTIRHLPCLHKFHKECIDQWLRRKSSCPVCKSGIT